MDGYIKLHRKFRDWEWYSEPVVKIVFLHLLITANWYDSRYKGHEIKAGQTIITVNGLAEELGFSVKQVRRAMEKHERTGEISKKRANRFTVVTIENWSFYQGGDTGEGSQRAMKGQTEGNQCAVKGQTERKATSIYKEKKEDDYLNYASNNKIGLNIKNDNNYTTIEVSKKIKINTPLLNKALNNPYTVKESITIYEK